MVLANAAPQRYLFDTDVLVHYLRGKKTGLAIEQEFQFKKSGFQPLVSIVTVGELLAFSQSLKWGENKRRALENLRRQLTILDISRPEILEKYAEMSSKAKSKGLSIFHKKNDLWIASTAAASGLTLVTCDKSDFRHFEDKYDLMILDMESGGFSRR